MFYAGKDRVLVSCDFSRQEPCLLASTCKDPKLIEAFHSGLDVYSQIASMIYNVPYEDCLEHYPDGTTNKEGKERRSTSKKIVLSIMYSKGAKTLAEDLHSTEDKAKEIMDAVLTAYPTMREWMNTVVAEAKKNGYADNLFGRRRRWEELRLDDYSFKFLNSADDSTKKYYSGLYLGKLKKAKWREDKRKIIDQAYQKGIVITDNEGIKAKATREIVNFYIQGGAAVITMRAMRNIWTNKRLNELGCKLIMSIHDESLCSVPKKYAYECVKLIEQCSLDAGKGLAVPLACDTAISENWYGKELTFDENHNLIPLDGG